MRKTLANTPFLYTALVAILCLATMSLLTLSSVAMSGNARWFEQQSLAFLLSSGLGFIVYRFFRPWQWRLAPWGFYLSGILALVLVMIIGTSIAGHKSWIRFGPFSVQPSEWAKVALIIFLSFRLAYLERIQPKWPYAFFMILAWASSMVALVLIEGDLGTSLLFLSSVVGALSLYPFPKKLWITLILIFCLAAPITYHVMLSPYQKTRIERFLHPESDRQGSGYQVTQSKITIGSGKMFGEGYKNGKHHHLHYLPARHSDFIFCVWAEEWGFMGSLALISTYLLLLVSLLKTAINTSYREGYYLGILTFWHLTVHIAVNLGGVLGLLPLTGVPLPFMSYGGSAVIANGFLIALVLSGYRRPNWLRPRGERGERGEIR